MKKVNYRSSWRRLDNTAKIFSLSIDDDMSVFRFSALLKDKIDVELLKRAVIKALEDYPMYRVKLGTGLFWNYLDFNDRGPVVEEEDDIPCANINFRKNNNYLFKVTYYKNKINIDFFHVLTDGTGAIVFFKSLIYHYLDLRYDLKHEEKSKIDIGTKDQYLKYFDKNYSRGSDLKKAYIIPGKVNMEVNNTYHYTVNINDLKKVCKKEKMTITEYLTALYIYSLYEAYYKKNPSNKEISVSIPINLRKHYNDETLSNFFTYTNIVSDFKDKEDISFEDVLKQVKKEYLNKLNSEKIKEYLARDVKLGMNLSIRLVPLFVKRAFIKFLGSLVTNSATSRLSNIGIIDFENKYKKYIDNVFVLVLPNKVQKIKCTVCSYDDKLNITMNSNISDLNFENIFFELLNDKIKDIGINSNNIIYRNKKRAVVCIRK